MATATQYNPNTELNARLLAAGASKTVYALVTPETEAAKRATFGRFIPEQAEYFDMFREAWTGKQDALHEEFFDTWYEWSKPVVFFARKHYPYYYPTAGASEALRQLIFDMAAHSHNSPVIHIFAGEYEGYKAMAEAAGLSVMEHDRSAWPDQAVTISEGDRFFISQPSAIDGNIWSKFNDFLATMPANSVVADITYVGAVSEVRDRFELDSTSVSNIVFSLSKPFGGYYDRIGGVFCRTENLALFGNRWFKNLTSLAVGTKLLQHNDVFSLPKKYRFAQTRALVHASSELRMDFLPSDVFILGTAAPTNTGIGRYLSRAGKPRICITPAMSKMIGTA